MESRVNELFKEYLQKDFISKTPSPQMETKKFSQALKDKEVSIVKEDINRLYGVMEDCRAQMAQANKLFSHFFSDNSEFIIIQRKEFDKIITELRYEIRDFKSEITKSLKSTDANSSNVDDFTKSAKVTYKLPFGTSKPLTPPSSFEQNILPSRNPDSLAIAEPIPIPFSKSHHAMNLSSPQKDSLARQKKRKKYQSPQLSKLPVLSERHKHDRTKAWLDSMSEIRIKRVKDESSDDEMSVSGWSCRSVRTISSRKRTYNIDRRVKSELGYKQSRSLYWGCKREY